jgi:hypothetical protein
LKDAILINAKNGLLWIIDLLLTCLKES